MRSIGIAVVLLAWAPIQSFACEVAITDARGAIAKIIKIFEPYKDRCRYEDEGIQCSVKDRSLFVHASAMPGYVPGYFAALAMNASEKADKERLATVLIDHLADRSPNKIIKPQVVRAIEDGGEFKFTGETCVIAVKAKGGTLDIVLAGSMVR